MNACGVATQHCDPLRIDVDHRCGHAIALRRAGGDCSRHRLERKRGREPMRREDLAVDSLRAYEHEARCRQRNDAVAPPSHDAASP